MLLKIKKTGLKCIYNSTKLKKYNNSCDPSLIPASTGINRHKKALYDIDIVSPAHNLSWTFLTEPGVGAAFTDLQPDHSGPEEWKKRINYFFHIQIVKKKVIKRVNSFFIISNIGYFRRMRICHIFSPIKIELLKLHTQFKLI